MKYRIIEILENAFKTVPSGFMKKSLKKKRRKLIKEIENCGTFDVELAKQTFWILKRSADDADEYLSMEWFTKISEIKRELIRFINRKGGQLDL